MLCREIVVQQLLLVLLDLPALAAYTLIALSRYRWASLREKLRTLREERLPKPRRSVFFLRSLDMAWPSDMDMRSRWESAFEAHGTVFLEVFEVCSPRKFSCQASEMKNQWDVRFFLDSHSRATAFLNSVVSALIFALTGVS